VLTKIWHTVQRAKKLLFQTPPSLNTFEYPIFSHIFI